MSKKLTLFIFSLIFFGFFNSVQAKDLRIIQLTDIHFSANNTEFFEKTIKDVNTINNVDFVVFTGDNLHDPKIDDLKLFLKIAKKLNHPYYILIGNHDVSYHQGLSKKKYMREIWKSKCFNHPLRTEFIVKKKGYCFLFMDGTKEYLPAPNGYYDEMTLARLDKRLKKYKDKEILIFQHYPLIPCETRANHATYESEKYLELLKKYPNVLAVISGHFHYNKEEYVNGVYHVVTPSVDTLSQYKIIDIKKSPSGSVVFTQLRTVK